MKRARYLLLVVTVLLVPAPSAHAQVRRVAVMDLVNTTKDPTVEGLGAAVADTVTTKLNGIGSLQLIER